MNESDVREKISDWLTKLSGCDVYWGEEGNDDYPNFQMEGTEDRPDVLVDSDLTLLLELKDANDSSKIYDGMKESHSYWSQIEFGDVEVVVDGDYQEIDAVAIATQFSPQGHLFKEEREQDYRKTYPKQKTGLNKEKRPQYEYARTEAIPRIMWRYGWQESELRNDLDRETIDTGLGVLLSDEIDTSPEQSGFGQFGGEDSPSIPKLLAYDGSKEDYWIEISNE